MLSTAYVQQQLGAQTIGKLQSTTAFLEVHGEEITGHFYQQLFAKHPELKNIFNMSNQRDGSQRRALAAAVYAFAAHLDDIEGLREQISRVGHKHVSLNVRPAHYPIVGYYLLEAIDNVVTEHLGADVAADVVETWKAGYDVYASLMIEFEADLYAKSANKLGGWAGLRSFRVERRVEESEAVVSFYLRPVDSQALPEFHSGQYVSLFVKPEGAEYRQIRQYSLSSASSERSYYRITVKRESGGDQALVSHYLHDHIGEGDVLELTPPMGDFVLAQEDQTPVVLLSAGVGVTPLVSMLDTLVDRDERHCNIHFVHAAEHGGQHVFKTHIEKQVEEQAGRLRHTVFYRQPREQDRPAKDFHFPGVIDLEKIREAIHLPGANYYLCGPVGFMQAANKTLSDWGVIPGQVHYEIFGPSKDI